MGNQAVDRYWRVRAEELGFSVGELKTLCNGSMLVWAETHRVIMDEPFSLVEYPYLEEIYMDLSREMCLVKSAQCFLGETIIYTIDGPKEIKDIKINDRVLTHTGSWRKVLNVFKRKNKNFINLKARGGQNIVCTKDHPFYANKFRHNRKDNRYGDVHDFNNVFIKNKTDWVEADDLMIGDFLATSSDRTFDNKDVIFSLKDYYTGKRLTKESNGYIWGDIKSRIKNNIIVDENLCRLFGYYASNGHTAMDGTYKASFAFNKRDINYCFDAQNIIKNIFDKKSNVEKVCENCYATRLSNSFFHGLFKNICGSGAYNKYVPQFMFDSCYEFRKNFLIGCFRGDGHITSYDITYKSVSKKLIYGIQQIIESLGYSSNVLTSKHDYTIRLSGSDSRKFRENIMGVSLDTRNKLTCAPTNNKIRFKRIVKKEEITIANYIDTYNLEVEKDNSYIANGYIVHNCGASEYAVNLSYWVADTNRGNPYYVFPTSKDMIVFVQGRVDPVKDETPYLNDRFKGKTDNTSIKRFGFRNMYFTGSQKRTQIISSPADLIIQDEYDEHNPDVDVTVQKRANNSKLKMFRRLSTPTNPGIGIHREYMRSSQGVWVHECHECKKHINVSGIDIADRWKDMLKKVKDEDDEGIAEYVYCCPHCKAVCDFTVGKWVHKKPKNKYHGYSINRMMTRTCSATELMKSYNDAVEQGNFAEFLRSDLGVPYEEPGSRIYEKDCVACQQDYEVIKAGNKNRKYFMGVDTGNKKHVTIGHMGEHDEPIVDFATTVKDYEELHKFFQSFDIAMCVIDNRPEPTPVYDLYKMFSVVRGAEHNTGIAKPTSMQGKEDNLIGYNRFFSIERAYNYILQQRIAFPKNIDMYTDYQFYKQLTSQMKISRTTDSGQRMDEYRSVDSKKKRPDHFLFSTIYFLAAIDIYKSLIPVEADSGIIIL